METARLKANQAKDLRADLDWWEENPTRLLEDIQRRSNAKAGMPGSNAVSRPSPTADARILIKDGRTLLSQNKIEEAEELCNQANVNQSKGWGLFEDSPEKLHADIQRARSKRDRDEAVRLMTDARKLFAAGNIQEAKQKASNAQRLHGPYTIWDLGDRPQKLLEEIAPRRSQEPRRRNDQKPGRSSDNPPLDRTHRALP